MSIRIGTVTNVYPDTGKVRVNYEDENNASLKLPMLTMNQEYLMPSVGDRVITIHMENGSSKGFVFGSYYGGRTNPLANGGYRKDFGGGVYAVSKNGAYTLSGKNITISGNGAELSLKNKEAELSATAIVIEGDDLTLKCSYGETTLEDMLKRIERIEDELGLTHSV